MNSICPTKSRKCRFIKSFEEKLESTLQEKRMMNFKENVHRRHARKRIEASGGDTTWPRFRLFVKHARGCDPIRRLKIEITKLGDVFTPTIFTMRI